MSTPDRIITNGNGTTYYTIRKAQLILAEKLTEFSNRMEGELKLIGANDLDGITRIAEQSLAVGQFAKELNDEFTKFIIL